MTFEEYQAFVAQGFTRIPVAKTVLADFDTPLSSYLKLADAPYSYLLESVHGGEKWGRYSIIGLPCRRIFKVMGYDVIESTIDAQGVETVVSTETVADPLATVAAIQKR